MQNYNLVSIVTPTWNCAAFICETIRSVQSQTYSHWELLIQDDCSSDGTDKVVAPLAELDSRIKYACNSQNSGAAITRNNALKRAKGRWISFLDSDDLWMPEKLEKQLEFMVENEYHFSYTNYLTIDKLSHQTGVRHTGPKHISRTGMRNYCWIGCLTVMYDADYIGLIQIEDIKKNNDYAMWLKAIRKADCHLLNEDLAMYRVRAGSISRHSKLHLIKWHYKLFRICEKCSPIVALLQTLRNIFFGVISKVCYTKCITEKI